MADLPTLLLVHGSWHGPWCWEKLTPELEARGLPWTTVALPSVGASVAEMAGMVEDAAAIEMAAAAIPGDVIVVAHSYGGVPVTQARFGANVGHLVYLGAFMPDVGQALVNLLPPGPLPPFVVPHEDGSTSVHPDHAVAAFYADCPPDVAAWAIARLSLHNVAAITTPVTRCAWRELSSSYILLTEDNACPTVSQRLLVGQATESYEMEGAHFPFLAKPAAVADLLAGIAARHRSNGTRMAG